MLACASEEQLAGFVLGTCGPDESRSIAEHLRGCASCRSWVQEASSEEGLFNSVRRVLSNDQRRVAVASTPTQSSANIGFSVPVRPAAEPSVEGYRIIRELGRGGMGVVYLALQESTKRKVALKVLLEGPFASPAAKRRFEREVELAALLDHPHIVTVLESGIASGRYYFAMRYVEGQRMDEYLGNAETPKRRDADNRELLKLFAKIAEAVGYAHRRGVIHRDLKPSNVVVDDAGEPYILDFGLAKPVEEAEEDATKLSVTGRVMGTLAYMSPEQSTGAHRAVDVRSDVYALGVMLYQMLSGQFPYPVTGRVSDILRHISETEPAPLRKRAAGFTPALTEGRGAQQAKSAGVNPAARLVNDEVETIVLKALGKDPNRRYQSADALASDIRRYLSGQPIEAKRDSGWYVARKLLARYRVSVGVAAAFLVLVGVGTYLLLSQQARIGQKLVREVLAAYVDDPNAAVRRSAEFAPGIRGQVAAATAVYAASPAYTERVAAARSAPWMNPEAFWQSVDGGPLWEHGEWLELCEVEWEDRKQLIAQLSEKSRSQSIPERYVAFCLLGQMRAFDEIVPEIRDPKLAIDTREATAAELDPGALAASRWAQARSGRQLAEVRSPLLFADELAGLSFARLSGAPDFRRGSPPDDHDRYDDEDMPSSGASIAPFHMATTEVTYAAFAPFLDLPGVREALPEDAQSWFGALEAIPLEERNSVAVGHISLNLARRYCEWLNQRAAEQKLAQRYRLPTEAEWEYACGAGNAGRYCYGDDPKYLRHFAQCDGQPLDFHKVGLKMPNAFGLHDMHGGLWERTETRYPPERVQNPALVNRELWISKGGAFYSSALRCRRAQRTYSEPNSASDYFGFRIVMEGSAK